MSNDSVTYGCVMALLGSFFAGSSMVLQKVGVRKSRKFWWLGILCLILGEVLTVVAYTNAPAVLVSPLGAMRVIVTTLLSVKYLREQIQESTKELFLSNSLYIIAYFKATLGKQITDWYSHIDTGIYSYCNPCAKAKCSQ